ncbi:hypothetical protein J6590_041835, partial [Homalodisca vitripennis]
DYSEVRGISANKCFILVAEKPAVNIKDGDIAMAELIVLSVVVSSVVGPHCPPGPWR